MAKNPTPKAPKSETHSSAANDDAGAPPPADYASINFVTTDPIATASPDQAPTLSFAPYKSYEEEPPYSNTLLKKSNALAAQVWNGKEGYETARFVGDFYTPVRPGEEDADKISAVEDNAKMYNRFFITNQIHALLSLSNRRFGSPGIASPTSVAEVIKKLQRLERKHNAEEILSDDQREKLINTVLFPLRSIVATESFGGFDGYFDLRFPAQKAILNGLLTDDEMESIQGILMFVPYLRNVLNDSASDYNLKKEDLLKPLFPGAQYSTSWSPGNVPTVASLSIQDHGLLTKLKRLSHFFTSAIPHEVLYDNISSMKYPRLTGERLTDVQKASANIREVALAYVREDKPLSALLEAIVELQTSLVSYYTALNEELNGCFAYLNKIGLRFTQLVEESSERLEEMGFPF